MPRRITTARNQVAMLAPWRRHAEKLDFKWERSFDGAGGWILVVRNPDGNPVTIGTKPTSGQRSSARTAAPGENYSPLSDEDLVSVAEQAMERGGHGREGFHVPVASYDTAREKGFSDPHEQQRHYSAEAENFVNGILKNKGWKGQQIRVQPEHWDLREQGSGQAVTDGANYIGLSGTRASKLSLLHETAHILTLTTHDGRREGHGPEFQSTLHDLYHEHLGPEAAATFSGITRNEWPDERDDMRESRQTVGRLAVQQPPTGLTFRYFPDQESVLQAEHPLSNLSAPAVSAHLGDKLVGYTMWEGGGEGHNPESSMYQLGEVSNISVHKDHRRQGIGSALFDFAREQDPSVRHSEIQTEDGKAWASGEAKRTAHIIASDQSLEEHLRSTYQDYPPDSPTLPDSLKPHLMLPTDIARHYREHDRPVDDENTRMLTRVIADQGIRQPLRISTDGTHAILHEGNHRVTVARQLGMSHVPVQVTLEKPGEIMTNSEASRPVPLESVLGDWVNQNRQNLKSFWS